MLIGCTKKLQEEMGIVAEKGNEENDLFCWSAHVVKVKRKKAVVVVNDSNRFGFVLFGLKAKDLKIMNELILDGIRRCLQNEDIKEEVIDQYLREAGEISFSKTRGPKYVSRLNKACELVDIWEEVLDAENIYQCEISSKINNYLITVDKKDEYKYPHQLLLEDFKKAYGDSIIKCEAAILLLKLDLGTHTAERKVITPINIKFKGLHEILQGAFNWMGYHLHDFNVINEKGKHVLNVISKKEEVFQFDKGCKMVLESEAFIKDYMKDSYKILYCYDYGDDWQHQIIVQGVIPDYDKNYPICLEGIGDPPPEDVGGIPGYEEFLEIMENTTHPAYEETKGWAVSKLYKKFDIDLVNRRLRNSLKR